MARQAADESQPAMPTRLQDSGRTPVEGVRTDSGIGAATPTVDRALAPEATPAPHTSSGAGVPAEQVQWATAAAVVPALALHVASPEASTPEPIEAAAEPEPAPEPVASVQPMPAATATEREPANSVEPAVGRPTAVVRATEPPVREPEPEPIPEPVEPRPAVRVAGIRVPLKVAEDISGSALSAAAGGGDEPGPVPEIELSSPVEMWFGEHRVGVKQGTATFDRLQRYAETLLSDLRESRDDTAS